MLPTSNISSNVHSIEVFEETFEIPIDFWHPKETSIAHTNHPLHWITFKAEEKFEQAFDYWFSGEHSNDLFLSEGNEG